VLARRERPPAAPQRELDPVSEWRRRRLARARGERDQRHQ
jgi:hypothetical protein